MAEPERMGDDDERRPPEVNRVRRGHDFYPSDEEAARIPTLYATDGQPFGEKVIHLKYFAGGSTWWLAEFDAETGIGFGYTVLNGDDQSAEWGYISLPELETIYRPPQVLGPGRFRTHVIVERDLYWTPTVAADCELPGARFKEVVKAPVAPLVIDKKTGTPKPELVKTNAGYSVVNAPGPGIPYIEKDGGKWGGADGWGRAIAPQRTSALAAQAVMSATDPELEVVAPAAEVTVERVAQAPAPVAVLPVEPAVTDSEAPAPSGRPPITERLHRQRAAAQARNNRRGVKAPPPPEQVEMLPFDETERMPSVLLTRSTSAKPSPGPKGPGDGHLF